MEPLRHAFGDDRPDAGSFRDLFGGGLPQRSQAAKAANKKIRVLAPHVRDPEREQHSAQGSRPGSIDRGHDVGGRLLAQPLQRGQLRGLQFVEVGRVFDESLVDQPLDQFLAHAVDVHGALADEVLDGLHVLGRACGVGAADGHLAGHAHHRGAARRAVVGHAVGLFGAGAQIGERRHHLGDHVARPLDDHHVAFAEVLVEDDLLVVEGGLLHRHAADLNRVQLGPGVEHARPAHVDVDVEQPRLCRDRGEFVGHCPAGRSAYRAERPL